MFTGIYDPYITNHKHETVGVLIQFSFGRNKYPTLSVEAVDALDIVPNIFQGNKRDYNLFLLVQKNNFQIFPCRKSSWKTLPTGLQELEI